MSKKSIRSKGYRKSAKKPYLSKRDILIVVGVIAVIVIGIVLFNLLYDDGSLDVVDGVAQVQGENSLLINAGSANSPRYFKLGQLADIEGYALESAPAGVDENVREFTYVPEGDSPYDEITVNANANAADILCAATLAAYSSAENTVCSEQMSMDLDGREVLYFTYQREYADETADGSETTAADDASAADSAATDDASATDGTVADDASTADDADGTTADSSESGVEEIEYLQVLNAYVPVGDRSIVVHLHNDTASEAEYLSSDELVAMMEELLSALSFETE